MSSVDERLAPIRLAVEGAFEELERAALAGVWPDQESNSKQPTENIDNIASVAHACAMLSAPLPSTLMRLTRISTIHSLVYAMCTDKMLTRPRQHVIALRSIVDVRIQQVIDRLFLSIQSNPSLIGYRLVAFVRCVRMMHAVLRVCESAFRYVEQYATRAAALPSLRENAYRHLISRFDSSSVLISPMHGQSSNLDTQFSPLMASLETEFTLVCQLCSHVSAGPHATQLISQFFFIIAKLPHLLINQFDVPDHSFPQFNPILPQPNSIFAFSRSILCSCSECRSSNSSPALQSCNCASSTTQSGKIDFERTPDTAAASEAPPFNRIPRNLPAPLESDHVDLYLLPCHSHPLREMEPPPPTHVCDVCGVRLIARDAATSLRCSRGCDFDVCDFCRRRMTPSAVESNESSTAKPTKPQRFDFTPFDFDTLRDVYLSPTLRSVIFGVEAQPTVKSAAIQRSFTSRLRRQNSRHFDRPALALRRYATAIMSRTASIARSVSSAAAPTSVSSTASDANVATAPPPATASVELNQITIDTGDSDSRPQADVECEPASAASMNEAILMRDFHLQTARRFLELFVAVVRHRLITSLKTMIQSCSVEDSMSFVELSIQRKLSNAELFGPLSKQISSSIGILLEKVLVWRQQELELVFTVFSFDRSRDICTVCLTDLLCDCSKQQNSSTIGGSLFNIIQSCVTEVLLSTKVRPVLGNHASVVDACQTTSSSCVFDSLTQAQSRNELGEWHALLNHSNIVKSAIVPVLCRFFHANEVSNSDASLSLLEKLIQTTLSKNTESPLSSGAETSTQTVSIQATLAPLISPSCLRDVSQSLVYDGISKLGLTPAGVVSGAGLSAVIDLRQMNEVAQLIVVGDAFSSVLDVCTHHCELKERASNVLKKEMSSSLLLHSGFRSGVVLADFCHFVLNAGLCSAVNRISVMKRFEILISAVATDDSHRESFITQYQLHLASRLLQNSFHSIDVEREAIEVIFGSTESPKLGGARRLRSLLDDYCQAATPMANTECQVMIRQLNIGIWPAVLHASPALRICRAPIQFKHWMESHFASMSARESNLDTRSKPALDELNVVRPKKLVWNLAASSVELLFRSNKCDVTLRCTTFQAFALLAVDGHDFERDKVQHSESSIRSQNGCTVAEMASFLSIDLFFAQSILHSLACGKFQILRKQPPGRQIAASDRFLVNEDFSDVNSLIVLPLPLLEAPPRPAVVEPSQNQDRSLALDACIMRVMKQAQSLPFDQLSPKALAELYRLTDTHLSADVVRKRVDNLKELEYLSEQQPGVLNYIP